MNERLQIFGNEEQLRSAVSNLVYNAVNHTPPGTRIEVCWQKTPQGAQFQVSDNGAGIAAEHLPRLTERFYRVDKARSRQTGGSGLDWRLSNTRSATMIPGWRSSVRREPVPALCLRCLIG